MDDRILVVTDSFGYPRPEIMYDDTFVCRLRESKFGKQIVSLSKAAMTSSELSDWNYGMYLLFYKPQYVILSLGITDCAPRYFRHNTELCISYLPRYIKSAIFRFAKIFRSRNIKRTWVSASEFYDNFNSYIQKCRENGVYKVCINLICNPSKSVLNRNPRILDQIIKYNSLLIELSKKYNGFIEIVHPLNSNDPSLYISDGYHPNKKGHELMYKAFYDFIQSNN